MCSMGELTYSDIFSVWKYETVAEHFNYKQNSEEYFRLLQFVSRSVKRSAV